MGELWNRYREYYCEAAGVGLDISRMKFPHDFMAKTKRSIRHALMAMRWLEWGEIANPDEHRQVGHYWLRNPWKLDPDLAPDPATQKKIEDMQDAVDKFAAEVHGGVKKAQCGKPFSTLLVIGIGGSALGPQFVAHALGGPGDLMKPYFLDNTDPDGIDRVLDAIGSGLAQTLNVVISKSGKTPETRNGMLEAKAAYERLGLDFHKHAVAVTGEDGPLHDIAKGIPPAGKEDEVWLGTFPMWDWVGGRTSETSAVGLLPAALQGIKVSDLLSGAQAMDQATRVFDPLRNPAALLALMWYHAGQGRGAKAMVILPYKDRLELFSRYLQQLVMESLGKELDPNGQLVNQGLTVFGNKGSTDQHAYVQQLREGTNDFFATFIEVLKDREGRSICVDEVKLSEDARVSVTSGDFLCGFLLGTRCALYENGRESITITLPEVSPGTVGKLIALFERAVGLYASLIGINAYHQPGVEAGKRAAAAVLKLQAKAVHHLRSHPAKAFPLEELAHAIGEDAEAETLFAILRHLAANGVVQFRAGLGPFDGTYSTVSPEATGKTPRRVGAKAPRK